MHPLMADTVRFEGACSDPAHLYWHLWVGNYTQPGIATGNSLPYVHDAAAGNFNFVMSCGYGGTGGDTAFKVSKDGVLWTEWGGHRRGTRFFSDTASARRVPRLGAIATIEHEDCFFYPWQGWTCITTGIEHPTVYDLTSKKKHYALNLNDFTTGTTAVLGASKDVNADDTVTADVILGTVFSLSLNDKKDGTAHPITLSAPTGNVTPALTWPGKHLWPAVNLDPVGKDDANQEAFVAVHEGTATMDVTIQGEAKPLHLKINVFADGDLGNVENDWDTTIMRAANERGIPPSMLKGQAAQESGSGTKFDEYNFRYEPCTSDWMDIQNKKTASPYKNFLLDAARTNGTFQPDFLDHTLYTLDIPIYSGSTITGRQAISDADHDVKAREIVKAMNEWPIGSKLGEKWVWFDNPRRCRAYHTWQAANRQGTLFQCVDQNFDFVAQPTMASSFGLFQVMYTTATDKKVNWRVTLANGTTSQNPEYLFDTPANHAISGGGSFMVGSGFDARNFGHIPASYGSRTDFEGAMKSMFGKYNPGNPAYGSGVMQDAKDYPVVSYALSFE